MVFRSYQTLEISTKHMTRSTKRKQIQIETVINKPCIVLHLRICGKTRVSYNYAKLSSYVIL